MIRVALIASIACSLYAADSAVVGPTLGYVNSAAGIRGVLGVVGSARLSAPLTGELQGAAILPGLGAAVAKNPSGALVRVNLKDGSLLGLGIEDVAGFAVSPSGTAIVASAAGRLRAVSADGQAKGDYAPPGVPRLMAISDEGTALAVSVPEGEGEALYIVDGHGARRVFHAARIAALAYMPGSQDAIFAAADGAIYRLKSDLQFARIGALPGTAALAGTADGRAIAVAGKTVMAFADGSPESTADCACAASIAQPLGQSRFLLTPESNGGPVWMVDASAAGLRVAFIPEAVNE